MKKLDLGCGRNKQPGYIGVDVDVSAKPDIWWDLNKFPYPFENNEFDEIHCYDVLEHIQDHIRAVKEIWRITKPKGLIHLRMPYAFSPYLWENPQHYRGYCSHSFDYYLFNNLDSDKFNISEARFRLISKEFDRTSWRKHWFDKLARKWINRHIETYEARLAGIYPVESIYFELEVQK